MPGPGATAISVFEVAPGREPEVALWQVEIDRLASVRTGFIGSRFATQTAGRDRWAVAISFTDTDALRAWLESGQRSQMLERSRTAGFVRAVDPDVVIEPAARPPAGTAVFLHAVAPGREQLFVEAETALHRAATTFDGYRSAALFAPGVVDGRWLSVTRFATPQHLDAWLRSPEREAALRGLNESLTGEAQGFTERSPFGAVVRFDSGTPEVTPAWRSAMSVLLVLFPTVMLLSRFLSPRLDETGVPTALAVFVGNAVSVGLLTWLLMPLTSRVLHRWLDPIDGRSLPVTLTGAAVIVALYVISILVFANVPVLELSS